MLREPNGRPSRAKEDPRRVAMEARMRILGLTASEALSDLAADNLGRLHLAWRRDNSDGISADQYNAAERYRQVYNGWRRAHLSPGAYYEHSGTVGAFDPDAYEDWVKRVEIAYLDARRAIDEAQQETRNGNLYAAVQYMLEMDQYYPHMLGDIRLVCNALYRHFFTQKRKDGTL